MPDSNDGAHPPIASSDEQAYAAFVLIESLIHALIARSLLTVAEGIEILESAMSVQADVAEAADGAGDTLWRSHALLASMADSLRQDLPRLPR